MIKPSILHLSTGKTFRGGERQVRFLHEGLIARGIESWLASPDDGAFAGLPIACRFALKWKSEWDVRGLLQLIHLCKELKPSVIHCHDGHGMLHGAVVSQVCGIPLVATRRVIWPIGKNPLTRWKYGRCRAMIAISSAVKTQCETAVGESKVRLVHDGVAWGTGGAERAEARLKLGIPDNGFCVATVGHFSNEKNVSLVLSVARHLADHHPAAVLALVGPVDNDLLARFNEFRQVVCCGMVREPDRYYRAFDVYISTSRAEGLGTALLDAVVRDVPVVSTDAGGTGDMFPIGTALVRPDDHSGFIRALDTVITRCEEARKTAIAFGVWARERFSVDRMVEAYVEVYNQI